MALTAGTRFGPYEIAAQIGVGGMGEVYRARDQRLAREVAVKVLPSTFATDVERVQRFEQEARAAAALNHPNILAVHDIGTVSLTDGSMPYIVSELLEGETLAERFRGGQPLPIRKAVDYAVQIARGLTAAHEKGIVHRDLKPANVFITHDGRVKILDFGLAKLIEPDVALASASVLPTAPPATSPGVVLGTIGYMSPEQVRGKPADHRTDIFAFGTILYEMLAGRRAFEGETTADTLTAILKEDPADLPLAERHIPPALGRIVDRCLEKHPSARFQSASDLGFALDALSTQSGSTEALAGTTLSPSRRDRLAWAVTGVTSVALVGALSLAAFLYTTRQPIEDARTMQLSIALPEGWQLATGDIAGTARTPLVISPDGRRLAMIARRAGGPESILIRSLDSQTVQPLAATEGAFNIFWSPDSRFLGFVADRKLKKIDTSGGPPTTLSDLESGIGGGTWNRNGVIVLAVFVGQSPKIQAVSANGGAPATVASTAPNEGVRPWFLPDGRRFLYGGGNDAVGRDGRRPLYAASLDSPERVKIAELRASNVQYAHGHLLFAQDGTLMAQPFDHRRLATTGDAFPIAENIAGGGGGSGRPPVGFFSVSDTGILVYQPGAPGAGVWLAWVDRAGKVIGSVGDRADYRTLALSPDATKVAAAIGNDLWIVDASRGVRTRFTFDGTAQESSPVWSADGGRIAFVSSQQDKSGGGDSPQSRIYQKSSNGTETEELLVGDEVAKVPWDWSRDGRLLLYGSSASPIGVGADFVLLPLLGDRKPRPLLTTPFGETRGKFSPDGRWIAYESDESGNNEIYVIPFSGDANAGRPRAAAGKLRVSTNGGTMPRWRRDGKELFFLDSNDTLMAVTVDARSDALQLGEVTPLFAVRGSPIRSQYTYDVSPDGQRFLVTSEQDPRSGAPSPPITIVVNWLEGLRK